MTAEVAGAFLSEVADRWEIPGDRAAIRAVLELACGGQMAARRPDGRRASILTTSGSPFEISVTGGGGKIAPTVRYAVETATQETSFAARLLEQSAAIRDLVAWLPSGNDETTEMLQTFVSLLYPEPMKVPGRFRSPVVLGVVHEAEEPQRIARLKVYGFPQATPGTLARLCDQWPGFAELPTVHPYGGYLAPGGAALEVDARGEVTHKLYLRTRSSDVAVPMMMVRLFGEQVWKALSELVDCGIDATTLHQQRFFVSCACKASTTVIRVHLMARRCFDLTRVVKALAVRNFGNTDAVDALPLAAEAYGATWSYSAVGLGYSSAHETKKLNVYGVPTWGAA